MGPVAGFFTRVLSHDRECSGTADLPPGKMLSCTRKAHSDDEGAHREGDVPEIHPLHDLQYSVKGQIAGHETGEGEQHAIGEGEGEQASTDIKDHLGEENGRDAEEKAQVKAALAVKPSPDQACRACAGTGNSRKDAEALKQAGKYPVSPVRLFFLSQRCSLLDEEKYSREDEAETHHHEDQACVHA